MIAKVTLVRRVIPDAIAVPFYAIIPRENGYVVMVENEGKAHSKAVELGVIGNRVQVLSGLEPGDRLIVSGQRELADGQNIRVVSSDDESGPAAESQP